ncbi:hypothetical protein [Paracoccus alkanivorans]|nr:hypothetical protein [Paracoccus alkanivorans]
MMTMLYRNLTAAHSTRPAMVPGSQLCTICRRDRRTGRSSRIDGAPAPAIHRYMQKAAMGLLDGSAPAL